VISKPIKQSRGIDCGFYRLTFFVITVATEKEDLSDVGFEGVDWIELDQDRIQYNAFVNTLMNLQVLFRKQVIF
jgi:hypothetical protein